MNYYLEKIGNIMNRLIIIGNGFDLAHGINTSFKGFIESYLYDAFIKYINYDKLSKDEKRTSVHYFKDKLIEISSDYNHPTYLYSEIEPKDTIKILSKIEKDNYIQIEITPFFKILCNKLIDKNWVDIELEYSKYLKNNNNNLSLIISVNEQFESLKIKLIKYLKKQMENFSINDYRNLDHIQDCFFESVEKNELYNQANDAIFQRILKIQFLNFNYTDIIEGYIKEIKKPECEINYIHGKLNDRHEEVIFGFGDEHDTDYLEFENKNNNSFLKFMKTFGYLQSERYKSMVNFINHDHFQVHIYGHSCGLSDRTMFNQIFEHDNCISIKVFFHKKEDNVDDFTEKTFELSRHFKDKVAFRNKLVPKNKSVSMPQPQRH